MGNTTATRTPGSNIFQFTFVLQGFLQKKMTKHKKYFHPLLFTFYFLLFTFYSCHKAGTGGTTTVVALPQHHGASIKRDTVYVKFNAVDAPANPKTDYDLKVIGDSAENHVHLLNLKPGKYYLSAFGYDSTMSMVVKGGVAIKIKNADKNKEVDQIIPVTE